MTLVGDWTDCWTEGGSKFIELSPRMTIDPSPTRSASWDNTSKLFLVGKPSFRHAFPEFPRGFDVDFDPPFKQKRVFLEPFKGPRSGFLGPLKE
jgi:hypothetical protein